LTLTAVEQLFNFSATELLKGNKHIEFVLRDEQKKEMAKIDSEPLKIDFLTKYKKADDKKKEQKPLDSKPKYEKPKETKEVSTFGDLAALQELKKKLEEAGK
jgi:hypothetical protein